MKENGFMQVDDVKSYAYKIVQKLNAELREKGYLTISSWGNRWCFMEKLFYSGAERKDP